MPFRGFTTPSRNSSSTRRICLSGSGQSTHCQARAETRPWRNLDQANGEFILLPTFRLPTLIHTRSGNSKWLYEISHTNPLWINPKDAGRLALATGDLARVSTEIGHFVIRVWATEGIRPGVVACSHHLGRWRLKQEEGTDRWASALVEMEELGEGRWRLRQREGVKPFKSDDPDSERIFWQEGGVHQNLAFSVHPDPVSGSTAVITLFGSNGKRRCMSDSSLTPGVHEIDRNGLASTPARAGRCAVRFGFAPGRPLPGGQIGMRQERTIGCADVRQW